MKRLAYDMVDTMHEAGGVGLAANQVGELWRIIVLQMPEEEEARIYFNPEIIRTEISIRTSSTHQSSISPIVKRKTFKTCGLIS